MDRASGEEATSGAIKTIIAMVITHIPYCGDDDCESRWRWDVDEEDHDGGDEVEC